MSENVQVKKLIQAYESLEGALDGFDWGSRSAACWAASPSTASTART